MNLEELSDKLTHFLNGYNLIGAWNDRHVYFSLTEEQLKAYPKLICGLYLNLIMEGDLDKANELLQRFDVNHLFRMSMELVLPGIPWKRFIEVIDYMREHQLRISTMQLSAGRPTAINGVMDFTRLAPFLERHGERFIEAMDFLYDGSVGPAAYDLLRAEWYYQQDMLHEASVLVNRIIQEFDNDSQRRLLFVALYLQTKIAAACGTVTNPLGYIKDVRRFAGEMGEQEFSYNIDAAEAYSALFNGHYEVASRWLSSNAPDEFADFCMLDLYRYMVKIRCYIVNKRYMSAVAIAERLRPLLEAGNRQMDLCEMDLLLAVCYFRTNEKELAFLTLERVLRIAKRRGYYRLLADEGAALLPLLIAYIKAKGKTPFLERLVESTRDLAANYPLYLKPVNKGGAVFSNLEISILKFLEQGKTNEELAKYFFISENTVKFHLKNIYKKLDVSTVYQAVWEARLLGII